MIAGYAQHYSKAEIATGNPLVTPFICFEGIPSYSYYKYELGNIKEKWMKILTMLALISILLAGVSEGTQTTVTVRVKSMDAKFIGTTMGGALVVIKDAETGEVLAKGLTIGGTGDTQKIMVEPIRRGVPITDSTAAKYETTIDISEPKLVTIEVYAPYAQRQSMIKNTSQVWLIPGKNILGEGLIIEVAGFSVNVITPQTHEMLKLVGSKIKVPIRANVVMMCGCPITPNGIWDANKYEVKAIVKHNGVVSDEIPLTFANKTNTFEGMLDVTKEGSYEVIVYSFDSIRGNTGVDKTTFIVGK